MVRGYPQANVQALSLEGPYVLPTSGSSGARHRYRRSVAGAMPKTIAHVAGVPAETDGSDAAKALVKFLTSALAVTVLKQKDMEPS